MKKIILIAVALAALSGCAAVQEKYLAVKSAIETAAEATVNPKVVMVGAESFDTLQDLAAIYVALPRCTGTNGPGCSYYAAVAKIRPAIKTGRAARDRLEQFLADHPGQLGPQGLYDSIKASGATIQDVVNNFNIRTAVAARP